VSGPPGWIAPENDHRGVARLPATSQPSLAVVIPTYNRPRALALTLAGLCNQTVPPGLVVVADDGSQEDLTSVVSRYDSSLPIRMERQVHDGFGAGRARNLGASVTELDVVVFLDSDCIPSQTFIECHRFWHSRASNVVVAGSRVHVSAEGVEVDAVRNGTLDLGSLPQLGEAVVPGSGPADWRRLIYRRSGDLTLGDLGFRAAISSNVSVRTTLFREVGGFDPAFRTYGGEDTELAWRLWQQGAFVVPDNTAVCFHQVEPGEDPAWRSESRRLSRPLLADRIPHRFYRASATPFATVPKLSWLASTADRKETESLLKRLAASTFPDCELVLWGPAEATAGFDALEGFAARTRVITHAGPDGFRRALEASRGEVVAAVDGRAHFSKALAEKAIRRLDDDRRAAAVRIPYRLGDDVYRRLDDLSAIDGALGRLGTPLLAFVTRRELMKNRPALADPGRAVLEALGRSRTLFMPGDRVDLATTTGSTPRRMGVGEVLASDPRDLARVAVRAARGLRGGAAPASTPDTAADPGTSGTPDTPGPAGDSPALVAIDYIGFTEHNNLGDDAILVALRREMPWASLARDHTDAGVIMVGGGTLVNGARYYLNRVLRNDSPAMEKVVLGVGVRDPDFHGVTEPIEEWARFFDSSIYAGVRGPDSIDALRKLGYHGEVDIFGDPALLLEAPPGVTRDPGRVVVCPVWTSGNIMGGNDHAVFDALATEIARLSAEGREVIMLSAFPEDDRHLIALMRSAGRPDMPYVAGYENVDDTMELLAGAGLVIAERLHAGILAAAAGTPFIGLEYWPKHRDFARSVGLERCVVPTADLTADSLATAVRRIEADVADITGTMNEAVASMRARQRRTLQTIRSTLTG
jgi:GT2 family glycosyltransferase